MEDTKRMDQCQARRKGEQEAEPGGAKEPKHSLCSGESQVGNRPVVLTQEYLGGALIIIKATQSEAIQHSGVLL